MKICYHNHNEILCVRFLTTFFVQIFYYYRVIWEIITLICKKWIYNQYWVINKSEIIEFLWFVIKKIIQHRLNDTKFILYLIKKSLLTKNSFYLNHSTEADRDQLDWSGRKPLDYRKIHTTVSASTYSSEYTLPYNNHSTSTMPLPKFNYGTLNKTKRHKRAVSSSGLVHRTQSMLGISQANSPSHSAASIADDDVSIKNSPPNRSTFFSPELNPRHQKKYQSFSFRKKFGTIGKKFDRYDKDGESTA